LDRSALAQPDPRPTVQRLSRRVGAASRASALRARKGLQSLSGKSLKVFVRFIKAEMPIWAEIVGAAAATAA
jgi:hypothetical protein